MASVLDSPKDVILFDGICNFCNIYINYVIKHDDTNRFVFAPLQSNTAKELSSYFQIDFKKLNSIVVIHDKQIYTRSIAIIYIIKRLRMKWYNCAVFLYLIPPFVRDHIYNLIANKRYFLFGKSRNCMIPTSEIKDRFLA